MYRQIGRGYLLGTTVYTASNPPNNFTDTDVSNFLRGRIADGTLPPLDADNQNLYLVIMPQGVSNQNSGFIYGVQFRGRLQPNQTHSAGSPTIGRQITT